MRLKQFLNCMCSFSFDEIEKIEVFEESGNTLLILNQKSLEEKNYGKYGSWKVGSFAVIKKGLLICIRK